MKKILYIGNKLSKHGFTPTTIETLGPQLETLGYELVYASSYRSHALRLLHMIYCFFQERKKIKYVLIDTYSTLAFLYAFVIASLAVLFNVKYIPILHGGNLPYRLKKSPKLSHFFLSHACKIVSPSFYLKDYFDKAGFSTTYIPNNIDLSAYPFQERRHISPRLLWVRSFHEIYNPTLAIYVLERLLHLYPHAKLCLVGPDKDGSRTKVEVLAEKLGVTTNLEITGRLSKTAWIEMSRSYDIFLNTTNFDNMPVSILEAMALGLPVISTNVGGLPFLIENQQTGLLVPPNDDAAMSKAIISILETPDLGQRLSKQGRQKVTDFDWNNIQSSWVQLLS